MLFSDYKQRNIYPQKGLLNFNIICSLDNTTGISRFGFSGNSDNLEFQLSSGQLFINSPANLFLSSYSPNNEIFISGNCIDNSYDLWINNNPYALGLYKNTGYYDYFYVDSNDVNTNLSLEIFGETPGYSYDPFESYYSGQIIPLLLTNSGEFPFKIFSGEIINNNNFVLSGVNNLAVTGSKILNLISTNFSPTEQTIPINLYTNFGQINLNFTASGIPIESGQFYLFLGPNNNSIVSQIPNNYTATIKSDSGIVLITSLEYVSGFTGDYYKNILNTGIGSGEASGVITGSGIINNTITDTIYKYNPLNNTIESGVGTGVVSEFIIASGDVEEEFYVPLSGLASGIIPYLTGVTGFGVFTFNGIVTPAGGILTRSDLTGLGSGFDANHGGLYFGTTYSGVGSIFAKYTGDLSTISGIFNDSQYELITFVGEQFTYTGNYSKYYELTGIAYATGGRVSGIFYGDIGWSYEPGIYTFRKPYFAIGTGDVYLHTGFDPVFLDNELIQVTGDIYVQGYAETKSVSCDFELPEFLSTGIPLIIRDTEGNRTYPVQISLIKPIDETEYYYENSNNLISNSYVSYSCNVFLTGTTAGVFNNGFILSGIIPLSINSSGNLASFTGILPSSFYINGYSSDIGTKSGNANIVYDLNSGYFNSFVLDSFNDIFSSKSPFVSYINTTGSGNSNANVDLASGQNLRVYRLNGLVNWSITNDGGYANIITGSLIRTNISRLGNTPSGSGYFNNVFQEPFFTGNVNYAPYNWGWSEYLEGYTETGKHNYASPVIEKFIANTYLNPGTGSSLVDSGIMHFSLTGDYTGVKEVILKSTPSLSNQYSVISLFDSSNNLLIRQSGTNQSPYSDSKMLQYTDNIGVGTSYIITGLLTGNYMVVNELYNMTSGEVGYVSFTADHFSGCENWENLYFSISRSGGSLVPYWGKVIVNRYGVDDPYSSGLDYVSNSGSSVYYNFYLPPGQSGVYFNLPLFDDGDLELSERLTATLYLDGAYTDRYGIYKTATLTILDDDNAPYSGFCENPVPAPSGSGIIIFPPAPPIIEEPVPPEVPPIPGAGLIGGGGGGGGGSGGGETDPIKPPDSPILPTKSCCDHNISMSLALNSRPNQATERECECQYQNCPCFYASEEGKEFDASVNINHFYINPKSEACILGGTPGAWGSIAIDGHFEAFGIDIGSETIPVKYKAFNSKEIVASIPIYSLTRNCITTKADGTVLIDTVYSTSHGSLNDSRTLLPVCIPRSELPEDCCEFYPEDQKEFCTCEAIGSEGSSVAPNCPMGFRLEEIGETVPNDCECTNRNQGLTCYKCVPEAEGCNCSDFGLQELGFCGSIGESEVGVINMLITDETCLNYGTEIQCSKCGCCCPDEDGCNCGDGCCCCPSYEAPWGPECACVATDAGC